MRIINVYLLRLKSESKNLTESEKAFSSKKRIWEYLKIDTSYQGFARKINKTGTTEYQKWLIKPLQLNP